MRPVVLWALAGAMSVTGAMAEAPPMPPASETPAPAQAATPAAKPEAAAKPEETKPPAAEAAAKPEEGAKPQPVGPLAVDRGAAFQVDRSVVWLGGTQVLPVRATEKSEQGRVVATRVEPAGVLEVVMPATVLAGRDGGYLRVRALRTGDATLIVGDARMEVRVADDAVHRSRVADKRPRITGVVPGAAVWGEVSVGVEVEREPDETEPGAVSLVLPNGQQAPLVSEARWDPEQPVKGKGVNKTLGFGGPTRRLRFTLNADALEPGDVELVAVVERPGETPLSSEPVTVRVVRPDPAALVSDEAESLHEVVRPLRYGKLEDQKPLNLGKREDASGKQFVANNGANPPLTIPINAETPGRYQLMLTVGSDFAGGAFPSVGLRLDEEDRPKTGARLVDEGWHRLPIGRPIDVPAGEHKLVAYFENDFSAGGLSDRNLRTDRYELLRLDGPATPAASGEQLADASMSMMAGGSGGAMMMSEGGASAGYRAALQPNLHGKSIAGAVTLRGVVTGVAEGAEPPLVALSVNGKTVLSQRSAAPQFVVDRGFFQPGANTLKMSVYGGGAVCHTLEQTVTLAGYEGGQPIARRQYAWPMFDAAWEGDVKSRLTKESNRHFIVPYFSATGDTLTLPEHLSGKFELKIEARGDSFEGNPIAQATLISDAGEQVVSDIEVPPGGYGWRGGKTVELATGPKRLRIAFTNDHYAGDPKKDRNLYLAGVMLQEVADKDTAAPSVTLTYPDEGATVHGADALMLLAADDRGVEWAELCIDGKPTGVRFPPRDGGARMVLPVSLRGLTPGEHALSARVSDAAGNVTESAARKVTVLADAPTELGRFERAVRLLDRFGYGAEPSELAAVLSMGEKAYLEDRLFRGWDERGEQVAWEIATATHPQVNGGQVERRAVRYALHTPNPVRTRLVFFGANHFSTWLRKAEAYRKLAEFESLAATGPGPFLDMLDTSAASPAMLFYLDQQRSFAGRINENYAREIMELHSVGVEGGYTQEDVTQLAHLLTGWTQSDELCPSGSGEKVAEFRYDPLVNDPAPREVFGMRFPEAAEPMQRYDRVRLAVEMLASHPSTARYISTKLVEHYLTVPADAAMVDAMAKVFMESGGDVRRVVQAIAERPEFWSRDLPPRLTAPRDFAIRLSRVTGSDSANAVVGYLDRSAVGLFDRDTPDGYPEEDEAYTDSNVTLQRWRFTREIEGSLLRLAPTPNRKAPPDGVEPATWLQRVIDTIAIGTTGDVLSEQSNAAALEVLQQTKLEGVDRSSLAVGVVAQMPEASLR